ncbi:hypothetical protein D3C76_1307350 [compost metagenome]
MLQFRARREHQHAAGWGANEQFLQRLLAVQLATHVQYDYMRLELFGQGHGVHRIAGIGNHGILFFLFEQGAQACAEQRRVIGKQYSTRHGSGPVSQEKRGGMPARSTSAQPHGARSVPVCRSLRQCCSS